MRPLLVFVTIALACTVSAAPLDPAMQQKVDLKVAEIRAWAAAPAIVSAVAAQNVQLPAGYSAMTQEKWKTLPVLDPFVRGFTRNEAGAFLKTKKAAWLSEAFLNDATGIKVAFLAKTTSWKHTGSTKHDRPMAGETWQGSVEVDESTGQRQLQIAVPVLAEGKPIGSLVIGLNLVEI